MKALVLVSIFVCLLNITAGLNCYKCNDNDQYGHMYPDYRDMSCGQSNTITECYPSSRFCLTYEFKDCDNSDVCFERGCDWLQVCKSVGTHEVIHPLSHETVEVACCQGDLCNSRDKSENSNLPSSYNKLSNKIYFFCALFSSILSSVFVTF